MDIKTRGLLTAFTAILGIYATDSHALAVHSLTITGWDMQVAGSITFNWSVQQTNAHNGDVKLSINGETGVSAGVNWVPSRSASSRACW